MRKSISISLPENLKEEPDRLTQTEGASRSDLVCEALREYLTVGKFRSLRQKLISYAEVRGIYTDEDVFRGVS